ncbi:MAG TPA: MarR family transcriptional regulator [Steroidobacteraceae bacterium]|nr:MarR family transcriptional regulator [Steroidobacteraceae bacterium]
MARDRDRDIDSLAHSIELDLREIRHALRRPLDAEYARGQLTAPQRIVMQVLFHSEGVSLKDLCARVSLSHSTVSGIVDRLQAKGMVARSSDKADRRLTRIAVTPMVRQFMQHQAPRLTAQPLIEALSKLSEQDRRTIGRGLRILRGALEPDGDDG